VAVSPRWIIDAEGQEPWVKEIANKSGSYSYFAYRDYLKIDEVVKFYVPARVNLKVRFEMPYDDHWEPYTADKIINLEQGGEFALGKIEFEKTLKIYVRVIDEEGLGVEGIPVRLSGNVPHVSDVNGVCEFHVPDNVKSKFQVMFEKKDKFHKKELPFEVKDEEDEGKEFLFELSEEFLDGIFDGK
jgi:hypothetical protein